MEIVEVDINLPEDFKEFAHSEVQSGRYAHVDEIIVHAFYLLIQDLDRKGFATDASRAALSLTLEQTLAEFRQAITKKFARS